MLATVYALLISAALAILTIFIHYEVLTTSWPIRSGAAVTLRAHMARLLTGIFIAHLIEIAIYAAAYYLMHDHLGLGTINGATGEGLSDYFYYSITSYTTLGFGDLYPSGPIRIVTGIESLNGLVLIGWSTSYTYLAMQRFSRAGRRSAALDHPHELS
ncbi:MAG TPA: potassium channel family protein [Sphingomicrobium sp.]|nr:potassium channel family protein [Sphingomicrobium sp.]